MTTTEHSRARMRAYYRAHREKIIAYNREYRRTHKHNKKSLTAEEKLKKSAYYREYYARNREKIRARQKAWLAEHPGYMEKYYSSYKQQV